MNTQIIQKRFRLAFYLCSTTSPNGQPFIWKWTWFAGQWISKTSHFHIKGFDTEYIGAFQKCCRFGGYDPNLLTLVFQGRARSFRETSESDTKTQLRTLNSRDAVK